ncbi:MAG TPA: hypothetical protein DDZ97_11095 [Deltaproteobacteria bacterium]|nr:hypothetical protein [Deltaproteobacteria bacterium]
MKPYWRCLTLLWINEFSKRLLLLVWGLILEKLLFLEQRQIIIFSRSKDCAEETVDLKVSIQQSL